MVIHRRLLTAVVVLSLVAGACGSGDSEPEATDAPATEATTDDASEEPADETEPTPQPVDDTVRLNHIQVVGSHNSYHLMPEQPLFGAIQGLAPDLATSIEYSHLPLTEQLQRYGIRQLEIDVYADPDGGHYANRQALAAVGLPVESGEPALDEPGFKVLHTQDFDFETTCLTLIDCLSEVSEWSDDNPGHLPVMIMVEFKSAGIEEAAAEADIPLDSLGLEFTVPLEPTEELFADLESEITSVFDESRILLPDDVRGDHPTLDAAVITDGWPALDDVRGKVMFALVDEGETRDVYVESAPALEGRVMFTSAQPGDPDAAVVRVDDPSDPDVDELAAAGYLIRTRADANTAEARSGDTDRRDFALASGAHFVSTDYYVDDPAFAPEYFVGLPNGLVARCNPVTAPPGCDASTFADPLAVETPTPTPESAPAPVDSCGDFEGFAHAGDTLAVVGVQVGGSLLVTTEPGGSTAAATTPVGPLGSVVASGESCLLETGLYYEVTIDDSSGWADAADLGFLGATTDATAEVVDANGGVIPSGTVGEVTQLVVTTFSNDDPPSRVVQTTDVGVGDVIEVGYDVLGLPDDSLYGWRLLVFMQPADADVVSLMSVESTAVCRRGVAPDGLCV